MNRNNIIVPTLHRSCITYTNDMKDAFEEHPDTLFYVEKGTHELNIMRCSPQDHALKNPYSTQNPYFFDKLQSPSYAKTLRMLGLLGMQENPLKTFRHHQLDTFLHLFSAFCMPGIRYEDMDNIAVIYSQYAITCIPKPLVRNHNGLSLSKTQPALAKEFGPDSHLLKIILTHTSNQSSHTQIQQIQSVHNLVSHICTYHTMTTSTPIPTPYPFGEDAFDNSDYLT
jgi:hypothetical protein